MSASSFRSDRARSSGMPPGIALGAPPPRSGASSWRLRRRAVRHRSRRDIRICSSSREKRQRRRSRMVSRQRVSGWSANSRAISAGGFRWRSALASSRSPPSAIVQLLADAGHHILQRAPFGRVIEHVVGGDERQCLRVRQIAPSDRAGRVIAAIKMLRGEIEAGAAEAALSGELEKIRECRIGHLRRQSNHDLACRRARRHRRRRKRHSALGGAALAERQQPAEPAIGRAVGRKDRAGSCRRQDRGGSRR